MSLQARTESRETSMTSPSEEMNCIVFDILVLSSSIEKKLYCRKKGKTVNNKKTAKHYHFFPQNI